MSSLNVYPQPLVAPVSHRTPGFRASLAAYGIYSRQVQLHAVISNLNRAGVSNQDICLLLAPTHPIAAQVRDMRSLATEPACRPALTGLLEWLSKLGAVAIADVGLFISSRFYLRAFMCATSGASGQRRWETLSNLGIPNPEIKRVGDQIEDAGSMLYVRCEGSRNPQEAVDVLRNAGALETVCLMESSYSA